MPCSALWAAMCVVSATGPPPQAGGTPSLRDPEGHRAFEDITLHPQLRVLRRQPGQLGPIRLGQRRLRAARLLPGPGHPVAQRALAHPEVARHLRDRPARLQHDPHRALTELRIELPSP